MGGGWTAHTLRADPQIVEGRRLREFELFEQIRPSVKQLQAK